MDDNDRAPQPLYDALRALAQRRGVWLALVAGARLGDWSVLQYTPDGQATLLVPAMEAGALYQQIQARQAEGADDGRL